MLLEMTITLQLRVIVRCTMTIFYAPFVFSFSLNMKHFVPSVMRDSSNV